MPTVNNMDGHLIVKASRHCEFELTKEIAGLEESAHMMNKLLAIWEAERLFFDKWYQQIPLGYVIQWREDHPEENYKVEIVDSYFMDLHLGNLGELEPPDDYNT